MRRNLVWLSLLFILVAVGTRQKSSPTFMVDGIAQSVKVFYLTEPARLHEGDVIRVHGWYLVVRDVRDVYRFQSVEGGLLLDGVRVAWEGRADPDAWGIRVKNVPEDVDLSRTFVYLDVAGMLPPGLRYLRVPELSQEVCAQTDLVYLSVIQGGKALDCRPLGAMSKLRYLRLFTENPTGLEALRDLHLLSLAGCWGFKDASSLQGLRQLRGLELDGTAVRDLSPLAGLRLDTLTADLSLLEKLPSEPVSWRSLSALETLVGVDQAARFRLRNPHCQLWTRWEDPWRTELRGVTRVVIRNGGTCHTRLLERYPLKTVDDGKEIDKLVSSLQFESGSTWRAGIFRSLRIGRLRSAKRWEACSNACAAVARLSTFTGAPSEWLRSETSTARRSGGWAGPGREMAT